MFFKNKESKENKEINYYTKELINGRIYKQGNIFFMLKNDKAYRINTTRILNSWKLPYQEIDLRYPNQVTVAGVLGFRDGTLIQNAKNGKIYLISDRKKRLLTVPLEDYGWDWSEVIECSDAEAELHLDGEDIG